MYRIFLKRLFLILFSGIAGLKAQDFKIIHTDANDIRRHSLSAYFGIGLIVGGPQIRYSYVPHRRWQLSAELHYIFGDYSIGPIVYVGSVLQEPLISPGCNPWAEKHEAEIDFHIIDKIKSRDFTIGGIISASRGEERNDSQENTIDIKGKGRRILAFTCGVQYMEVAEYINEETYHEYIRERQEFKLLDLSTGSYEIAYSSVITDVRYTNAFFGIKFKSINANGIEMKGGKKRFNDIKLESYAGMVVPLSYNYGRNLAIMNRGDDITHILEYDKVLKPGWRIGVLYRNSIRSFFSAGVEITRMPRLHYSGQRTFVKLSLGYNFNFGKVNWIK